MKNYLQMLDEEAKIPLSEIQEEENPEHLKERMALYRKGDRGTYNWRCMGVERADEYAPLYAIDVIRHAELQKRQLTFWRACSVIFMIWK